MKADVQSVSSSKISNTAWHRIISGYLIFVIVLEMLLLFMYWPEIPAVNGPQASAIEAAGDNTAAGDGFGIAEINLLILVIVVGGLGASLHAATSVAAFVGNKTFDKNWVMWYFLRPFVGGILAVLFYFVIRAGFIKSSSAAPDFYMIIAISGLVGLFSKNALNKLSDVFETLFLSEKEEKLTGKLDKDNPVPIVKGVLPAQINSSGQGESISVIGENFVKTSVVRVNGNDVETTYVNNTKITAGLDSLDLANAKILSVTVFNPAPMGGESESIPVPVIQEGAPKVGG